MRRARASTDGNDDGSAALEFILVGLVLLVPIVYLIIALGAVQSRALGVEAGARHLARAIATADDVVDADTRAERVIAAIVEEYDLDRSSLAVEVACVPATAACPAAGAVLIVTVSARVRLPLVPAVLGLEQMARVPVVATGAQKVSRYWAGTP